MTVSVAPPPLPPSADRVDGAELPPGQAAPGSPLERLLRRQRAESLRVFIKGVNWVGDAIIATPALAHLRRQFPDVQITLMVRPWVAAIYENSSDIDELWVHDDSKDLNAFVKAVRMVRKGRFQIGIALPNSLRSGLLLRLASVPYRFGYHTSLARRMLLNYGQTPASDLLAGHQVFYYLGIIEGMVGQAARRQQLRLTVGELEREEIRRLLAQRGLDRGRPIVGLAPGSINSQAKRWPAERYAELADLLGRKTAAEIVLLGSGKEKEVCDRVATLCHQPVHNLAGELNLGQVIALMERLQALICNDSGAMHIAAALRVPTLAIFGPTEWTTTYPFSNAANIIRKEGVACAPCMLRECPIDHRCMTGIAVGDVLDGFRKVLQQAKQYGR
ncbi:MAG TPA: lipopolysaccharide heptosyltransferase II [Candidatus Sumerlaeota bacterium]|nr:lipopolysaccharide heptosyltransferase II [Candidatus Sumerlaeota bacterium]